MKTCRDEFDRLMETCPAIDNDIINEFKIKLTTGGDKTEMSRKLKNFNKLIKPDIFDELITLKDTVYTRCEIKIDILDRDRIIQEEIETKKHMSRVKLVNNFVEVFKQKYSRKPSIDEILSNLTDIKTLELRIILDEIEING